IDEIVERSLPTIEHENHKKLFELARGVKALEKQQRRSKEEIAHVSGTSIETLLRRCHEVYGATFDEVYARFADAGLVSLRRSQFNLAKKSASMAIFLGKNYLGQSDRGYTDEELAKAIEREMAALRAAHRTEPST